VKDFGVLALVAMVISQHQPRTGMKVAMGETCRCDYWTGSEEPGVTRPVGFMGLEWHQALELNKDGLLALDSIEHINRRLGNQKEKVEKG
jgi:hypothetical protein